MRRACSGPRAIYTRSVTWFGLGRHAAVVLVALFAGTAMPGGACLIDCVLSGAASEIAAAPNHCNAEPSLGSGGDACHALADSGDVALRSEYRLADPGPLVHVDVPVRFLDHVAKPAAAIVARAGAGHGPPGLVFPLRV